MFGSIDSAHRRSIDAARVVTLLGAILVAASCSNGAPDTTTSATSLAISSGNGQSGTVATALTTPLAVVASNAVGDPVVGLTVTFVATGGATLGSTSAVTNSSGVAQTTITLGQIAGVDTVTATASGSTGTLQFLALAGAGPATTVAILSGNNQSGTHGGLLGAPLVVVVKDQYGNVVPNASVRWTTNVGLLGTASSISDSTGKAQTTWTLPGVVGNDTTTATLTGTSSTAIFAAVAN
jgi:hypothetical protein